MTESNSERIDVFLLQLKDALRASDTQTADILAEVRGDIGAHVERHRAEGLSEEDAVERAIGEMGNPFELAHHMRREIPPFGGKGLTIIRYVAAAGAIVWTALIFWAMRAGTYGFSPVLVGLVVFLHLPAILLLWPRIVWKKNWLFGLIPAGLMVGVAMVMAMAGVESSGEMQIVMSEDGTLVAPETIPEPEESGPTSTGAWVAASLAVFSIVLLLAMQRRAQLRNAVIAIVVGAGLVEGVYQVEEFNFRKDRDVVHDYWETSFRENGAYPTEEEFKAAGPSSRIGKSRIHADDDHFTLFWVRPLSKGHSIVYESEGDRIRVND